MRLEERTVNFSKEVILFCRKEPQTIVTKPMINQLIRSSTSIGANFAEASNAASKTDFRNKVYIAKKEAAETKYWLTLIEDIASDKITCSELPTEAHYILMTLQKVITSVNSGIRPTRYSVSGKRTVSGNR